VKSFFKRLSISLKICFLITLLLELNGVKAQPKDINQLKDSIGLEIQKAKDNQEQLKSLLVTISKNRRNLKDQFIPLMEQYIEHTERVNFKPGLMEALDRLGHRERQEGNYAKAINYHLRSLDIATELADSSQLAYNYSNLGQAYRRQDYNALALQYFHKALEVQQALGDNQGVYFTQNSIGATYFAQEDYPEALYYIDQAVEASKEYDDKRSLSFNYGCLGEIYLAQNMVDSAINYFILSRKLKVETNQTEGIAVADHLLGQAYFAKGQYSKAQAEFEKALPVHIQTNNKRYQSLCLAYLGKIDIQLGRLESAWNNLSQAKEIALSVHSLENLVNIEAALTDYYKAKNNFAKAFEAFANSYAFRDSIISAKAKRNVQALEIEYQTKKKENEIELLSKENIIKSQRIRIGITLLVLLVTVFGLITTIYLQRQRNAKVLATELQHKLSRSQMNPHFVSNVMASIQKQLLGNNLEKSAEYLGKFAQLNRVVLEHSIVDSVPLDEEITMLSNYLEFEKLRLGNAFTFSIEVNDNLDTEMISIPPLFIQPFVENAVKHGVKDMDGDGKILIKLTDLDTELKVEVIDNGKGINTSESTDSHHKSRSMEIVKKRLQLLTRNYGKIPSLSIESNSPSSGLHVTLNLPIIS
jgi:tetratricopeptide (TPR) repeat protein